MKQEDIIKLMQDLSLCKITPEDWKVYWEKYEKEFEKEFNRTEYLAIKPRYGDKNSYWKPILLSQEGAVKFLKNRNIPFEVSEIYKENWKQEFIEFCNQKDKEKQEKIQNLKNEYPILFKEYPKFAKSLEKNFEIGDKIEIGASLEDMIKLEKENNIGLQKDILKFFTVCSAINIEGIKLELESIYPLEINKESYWVLGEFWNEADGDLILFKPTKDEVITQIYYYAHDSNKIKKLVLGMSEFIEKNLAYYNNQMGEDN